MLLGDLVRLLPVDGKSNSASLDVPVTGVQEDSRLIEPGQIFVARTGTHTNGARFLQQALSRGAVAVVSAESLADCALPNWVVPDPGAAVSVLAHALVDNPSRSIKALGITGTNGKTTTAYLVRHVLNHFNQRCGMIGTVEIDDGINRYASDMTTPAAVEVARLFAGMRANGCRACVMETSSHSLHQGRVAGVSFAGAAFTNLTGDHLDYHKTMDAYTDAKAMLFNGLDENAAAVVNAADARSARIVRQCRGRVVRFGLGSTDADYTARDISITAAGSSFILHAPDGRARIDLQLVGRHNIENAMTAIALLCEVFGLTVHQLASGLKEAAGAPGRLQTVRMGQPFAVLVDYAHTDDALRNVLSALRPLTRGRLRVLFGCGGDRDASKRPRMAAVAESLADDVYITSDNPRTEDPQSILDQVVAGLTPGAAVFVEADRRLAIEKILADAGAGDVVLIAGKGHENYQIIGSTKHHFDDVEECQRVLRDGVPTWSSRRAG